MARKDGLVVQEMPEEVLVYDLNSNKAHCLNQTAAFVWKSCDGEKTVTDITNLFKDQTGNNVNEDLVWLAIDQLSEKNLLTEDLASNFKGQNRREVIKKIGLATVVALPLVASLTAPTSVLAAASCSCGGVPANCAGTSCPSTVNCNGSGVCAP
jgi:hypothetical protein